MENTFFSEEVKKDLTGRKIHEVGDNYIVLDNGCRLYLAEDEIEFLNSNSEEK